MLPMLLAAAELKIDHVTVAGRDLKTMQADLEAVGIPSVYGGVHSNGVTEMAQVSFPDGSYLELIAARPKADPLGLAKQPWAQFIQGNAGPCAWAVRATDMAAEIKRLEAAGVAVSALQRGGRRRPDGRRLEWETAQVGAQPQGAFFPFLIHDVTPREQRAFPEGKPVTKDFTGVTKVVIAVRDLAAAVKRYRKAYALPPPIMQVDRSFGAHLAALGGTPVVLAQPLTADSWLAARIEQFGEGPCALVLGARRPRRYHAASQTRWFGLEAISWFDPARLGWRLGFERVER
jgi:Glyoxalase-like domain